MAKGTGLGPSEVTAQLAVIEAICEALAVDPAKTATIMAKAKKELTEK